MTAELVRLRLNGAAVAREVAPDRTLQELLRDELDRPEVRKGCGEGVCGSCTVLLDGVPVPSCVKLALQADGAEVVTAAGLDASALVAHFVAREAFQCGYCAPGMLATAWHLLAAGRPLDAAEVRRALAGHVCRCTGYQSIVEAIVAAAAGEPPPPAPLARVDLQAKLTGAVTYPTDVRPPGPALVGRILWSEHPAARIESVSVEAASRVPGVVRILTAGDVPGDNVGGTSLFARDQPLLAEDRVGSCGDAVALVAAETEAAARAALALIRVVYAPLPPVLDVGDPRAETVAQFTAVAGDADAALAAADLVVEDTYGVRMNDHLCLEREGGVGWMDGDTVALTVTSLTPHTIRAGVARVLGLPEARVRVETPRVGGSFGKYLMAGVEAHLGLLVFATGRPVRLVLERGEILARSAKRHPFRGHYRLGLRRDGTFVALVAEVIAESGAYAGLTPTVVSVFADEATGAYHIPHHRITARGVRTNNLPSAPMRGFGSQQITFGIESIVEKAARAVGLDPAELRRRNFVRTRTDGRGEEQAAALPLEETMRTLTARLGPRPAPPAPGWKVGRGVTSVRAKCGYPYGLVDRFVARVSLLAGGEIVVESDIPDSGSGMGVGLPRLVARTLGLDRLPPYRVLEPLARDPSGVWLARGAPPGRVQAWLFRSVERVQVLVAALAVAFTARVGAGTLPRLMRLGARPLNVLNALLGRVKSRLFPLGIDAYVPRTSGSRGMVIAGRAAVDAATSFRARAIALAAPALGLPEAALGTDAAGVHDGKGRRLGWAEVAAAAGGTLAVVGRATAPAGDLLAARTGNQVGAIDHMYASHGCDLAVHPGTGETRILRYVAVQDVGKVHDREAIRGQLLGAITMGVGQALLEHLVTEGGRVTTRGLHEYHAPTSLDAPTDVELVLLESGEGVGPGGAKGVGEVGAVAAPAAIASALQDALGVPIRTVTVTPEEIVALAALAPAKGESSWPKETHARAPSSVTSAS